MYALSHGIFWIIVYGLKLLDEVLERQMCLFYLIIELEEQMESSLEIRLMITSAFSSIWRFVLTLLIVLGVKIILELTY